eukprot:gene7260-9897_t
MASKKGKWATGLNQNDLMIRDECIVVNESDEIVGHNNKKDTHTFSKELPRGQLHRAFSVFLFNSEGKLLLQQRAAEKITFPNVWTNTCCSHPLYGFDPNEVDTLENVKKGKVDGVKNAAVRKLEHELGISSKKIKIKDFKYLTRLHYWAADVVTWGKESPWGEHEIDYILFIKADVELNINPEEVKDTKYVTLLELKDMMGTSSGLLWSPWFRIIVDKFLVNWWENLDVTLSTNKFVDYETIHRFDPTIEHMGGAGNAGPYLGTAFSTDPSNEIVGNQDLKQGAYGKVKIHKHSKLDQLSRIDEVFAAFWYKFGAVMDDKIDRVNENVIFCDDMLGKVSRSFASVIRQLPKGLCLDILIFYLALRALDTIEDDMDAFKGQENVKIDYLINFYKTALVTDGWNMQGVGKGDEKVLLEQYYRCVAVFKSLPLSSQEVIADISKRMGKGMAHYVSKDLGQGTVTVEDYNLYCHYVAGLVGEGLSRLFSSSGYESLEVAQVSTTLANTMGLFLQKANIIRDYLEDYVDGRAFWPQEIWKLYSKTGELGYFAKTESSKDAIACLNHLVTDALECVPQCMEYMDLLKTEEVFRFCAIPQVMAIATLAELYNNPKVFTGVVKIRKGLAVKLILDTKTSEGLHKWFYIMASDILSRIPAEDPNAAKTRSICNIIIELTNVKASTAIAGSYAQVCNVFASFTLCVTTYFLYGRKVIASGDMSLSLRPKISSSFDVIMATLFASSFAFIFGYSIVYAGRKK